MSTTKVTKAEAIARFHDKYAGWGDLRNHDMQKKAAEMLRRQEQLLASCLLLLTQLAAQADPPLEEGEAELLEQVKSHLQETEDAE